MSLRWLQGDCRATLQMLEPNSVQACITSPPYYGLRDYKLPPLVWGGDAHEHEWATERYYREGGNSAGSYLAFSEVGPENAQRLKDTRWHTNTFCPCGAWLGSLGLEPTPELYVEHIVEVFRQVRRVLRDEAVAWVNLGDSYAGSGKGPSNSLQPEASQLNKGGRNSAQFKNGQAPTAWIPVGAGLKPKDLMMMPFRVAMALQADGWYLRSVIPWLKRNSMPESVTDRPATSTEYVFLLAKSARYFWDADAVRYEGQLREPWSPHSGKQGQTGVGRSTASSRRYEGLNARWVESVDNGTARGGRNRRNSDWWFESWQGLLLDEHDDPLALMVNPAPFTGAHFATFPPKLVEPMVKASTSERGQCPDCGAPWARVTETELVPTYKAARTFVIDARDHAADGNDQGANRQKDGHKSGHINSVTITGWRPTCKHTAEPKPQTILDPFAGAGTVGLVADRLNRNAILCELSTDYGTLGIDRVTSDAPLFVQLSET